jgi:hypothetical protein
LPLVFEANRGQAAQGVRYLARGAGYRFYLTSHEAILTLQGEASPLRLKLVGSNRDAAVEGLEPLPGKSHYLIGNHPENWITNVPQFASVQCRQVYPGIDLVYHGDAATSGRLEYDFVVAPGADPSRILLAFDRGARIEPRSGDLLLAAAHSTLRQLRPRVFQYLDGEKREIPGRYRMSNQGAGKVVQFELGRYDRSRELVIDPVFLYGTVLPGSGNDDGLAVAADAAGNAYVTGYTTSTDFLTASPFQGQLVGGKDVFISKVNAAGTALVYSTYLGGSSDEEGHGIAVDASGNVYIAGWTSSIDFPTHLPLQAALLGTRNAFVAELNAAGSALVYSTYLGGSGSDQANAIALDSAGAAYITGSTNSTNFPAVSAWKASLPGVANAFVAKLSAAGTAVAYSTYLGGSGTDSGNGIAVDSIGEAYIVGSTTSSDFPVYTAIQKTYGGGGDAFVTKFNAAGSALTFSTFYGGSGQDQAYGIAIDFANSVSISGFTSSINTFPLVNALPSPPVAASGFLIKLDSGLGYVRFATILNDNGRGVAVDGFGNTFVGYISRINSVGTGIDYSLPVSGTIPNAIAVDGSGNVIVVGQGATLVSPSLATPKDFYDVSLVKVGETGSMRIAYLQPTTVLAGAGLVNVYITGTGFVSGAVAKWNGSAVTTIFSSSTQVNALVPASDLTTAGLNYVTVVNPSGAVSNPVVLTVQNPSATITSLSPSSATAGGAALTLTVNGAGFITGSAIYWNGTARTSTLVSGTQMAAAITAADIAAAGTASVQVMVPTPGGGLSASSAFTIDNPAPAITSLSPASISTGGSGFTLTVQGTGFASTSVVLWNGSNCATTFVSKAQLQAAITAADIAAAGTYTVTVFTPAPGGGTSAGANFAVSGNPPPLVLSLLPAAVTAGSGALTLTLTGGGFISSSQVRWNGVNRTTTFVSATQVTAAIAASDVATAGTAGVTVVNSTPGGGTSAAVVFPINNPTPVVATISPATTAAASAAFTLTVNGSGFVAGSQVQWNGASRTTTFVNSTQLTAAITAADVAAGGVATVTVVNAAPSGGTSNGAIFTITANPLPSLTAILPPSATVAFGAFTLTVTGSGFMAGSVIQWNGVNRTTTFVSSTQLTAAILAADLASMGNAAVTASNPTPGGGSSSSVSFTITANPAPVLASILPASTGAGSAAQTLTVTGSGFVPSSTVQWNGTNRATTFISATQLTAAIIAADVATASTAAVTVVNPTPGGGTSASAAFAVNNPAPATATLSPATVAAGAAAFSLTVNGSGFVASSTVQWNGANRATTYVSATQLTAAIPAADVATAGTATVTVANAAPGGGTSAGIALAITANPMPAVASILPASSAVGSAAFTLTLTGSGFVAVSQVQWNGANRATTYVSATQLTAAITATDVAASGTAAITVVNPAPGGGTSAGAAFAISNPTPAVTTISPATVTATSGAFTLTVNGGSFVGTSQVQWNGANRTTTYVSATQLTAAITTADVATAGAATVAVVNPSPGGGSSAGANFIITANPAPTLSSILPASAINNSGAFTLTLSGSGFVASSQVQWNASSRVTTFVSATQLAAAVTAADLASTGTAAITVVNPAPGGGTSSAISFTIAANPAPSIASILPSSAGLGSTALSVSVMGSGFIASSQVLWNGSARATTFISSSQLAAAILASDLTTAGATTVTVSTPTPGGGISTGVSFTITSASTPSVTSILPASVNVGSGAFTLTVTGSAFASSALVQWNGASRATTFVSFTQLAAAILAGDVAVSGAATVTVVNPSDGGTSGGVSFLVGNPTPVISNVTPGSAAVGSGAFTLTVNGTGFVTASAVQWNGANRATTYVSSTQLTAAITASDVATAGSVTVKVVNPAPGGGTSAGAAFTITANPAPVLASILPSAANAGSGELTLTVTGSAFIANSVVQWNGASLSTTYVSSTQLTADIPAANIATGGSISVVVVNPAPGGGASVAATFTVNNPAPAIGALTPSSAATGSAALPVTVTGSGFVPGSILQWNGANRATTYVSASQLTFTTTVSDLAVAGTAVITIVNSGPGGGTSPGLSFAISSNPAPAIASVLPASASAGSGVMTLTVTGSGFNAASAVQWNGASRATTLVNSNQITAAISAADLAIAGTATVTIVNPAPGGGTSAGAAFAINNPGPAIGMLSPAMATAGASAFTLTVNGTGFTGTSTVQWNGTNRATTFVSATSLTAAIPAADVASAASATVTILNPAPGGGTSAGASFAINVPAPAISTISPASATAGSTAQTLTVSGTGLVATSQVQWGGSNRTTTFVNATQLTAAISAGDLAAAGAVSVTVVNPAPGGGTSGASGFTVNNPAPVVTTLSPATATAGSGGVSLIITGSGFVAATGGSAGSLVQWNGASRATTFVSSTQLTATVSASDVATAGAAAVTVLNAVPGGGTSAPATFTINAQGNPAPAITTIAPVTANVSAGALTVTINGSGFIASSTVQWNGASRATTYLSATQLTAAIPAGDLATVGTDTITVLNPSPGGGTSAGAAFTVTANPTPSLASIVPSSAGVGAGEFTLTLTGSGFITGSQVLWNGANRSTTLISATQMTADIPASDLTAAGTAAVTVLNPAPGGGSSTAAAFTINNPAPVASGLSPSSAIAGSSAFTLAVTGSGFAAGSSVLWNGGSRATTYVSATQLTAAITAADVSAAGSAAITVSNPAPGGGVSAGLTFAVTSNPAPVLAAIQPASAPVNSSGFTLTAGGSGFVAASSVMWNGTARVTTFVSSTQLTAVIPASDLTVPGSAPVTVVSPAPGGGTSGSLSFTITANPAPAIASILPATAAAGGGAFALTVTGSGFVAASQLKWNGANRATTFVSATQLTAAIGASDLAAAALAAVTVVSPGPGGGTSAAVSFEVDNPQASVTSLSPSSIAAGSAAFTLTVNGAGFVAASTVQWNGASRATTFVSAAQLTATITAADVAGAATAAITVVNPAPGGGVSSGVSFAITANPVPSLTAIQPASAAINSGLFLVTASGSGFVAASQIQWNGTNRATTFVSASQLTAAITAADLASAGTATVTVVNPAPGGGASAGATFTITPNPAPVVASILPASANVASGALTLTVTGGGFVAASVVQWNGSARSTTFISATQLTAAIAVADLATAGAATVTVTNPAPGGGVSAASSFTINNPTPVITTVSPSSIAAGSAAFNLTINGSGFVAASSVLWNGAPRATTFVNASQLTAAITAADVASAGAATVSVVNPAPGGGASPNTAFTISTNPAPVLATIQPASAAINSGAFTLTLSGSGFISTSVAQWNGSARPTTFVSSTQITAAIPASDLTSTGAATVTVANPAPGGGLSSGLPFTVSANPAPAIASILPAFANVGAGAVTITVTGSGFLAASQAQWNAASRATTYVSATQLTVAITAADLTSAGMAALTVVNPAPGGGTSPSAAFAIDNPAPVISTIAPAAVATGSAAFTLTVNGSGFVAASQVQWNGANRPTVFVSATQLNATIPATDIATAGSIAITVTTAAPGGGTSAGASLLIASNPAPTLASILPSSATVGTAAQTLTATGGGFIPLSTVQWNGASRATTYISATQLTAAITAADLANAGTDTVTVINPAPAGGTSSAASFVVSNPLPAVLGLAPAAIAASSAGFSLAVNGSGFVSTSQVQWNGLNRTTTFLSGTQLSASITAPDLTSAGSFSVTVINPAPGGGASQVASFAVTTNPLPTLASILPASATVGAGSFTITVAGSGLTSASSVQWNGSGRATTYVSATQLTAAISAGDLIAAGTAAVTVSNPAPGGGVSTALTFTIGNPVPTLTSISPASTAANSGAFTLALNGSGFVGGSIVQWNGSNRATTVVSSTQLTAQITASDLSTSGTATVGVVNPTPGGGSSGTLSFAITANPAPSIATIAPSAAAFNSSAFTLTVTGSGFVPASQVQWNGSNLGTTFVSSTLVTAAVPASGLTSVGAVSVSVVNPAPGGGVSTGVAFTVAANPTPSIAAILPAAANAGSGAMTLTVTGSGFIAASQLFWNSSPRATTFVSSTVITAAIATADVATAGTANVTVVNPAPGGGASPAAGFSINNPTPTIAGLAPVSVSTGASSFTLTVNGSGFISGSQIQWNGTNRSTSYVNATQLSAAITAADVAATGTALVTAVNGAPGGGTSAAATFAINNPMPAVFTISPSTAAAGSSAMTVSVNGTGFMAISVAQWNGAARTTTYVSSTQLTAAIAAADLTTAGSAALTVMTPAPGGGVSAVMSFAITGNPMPSLAGLLPATAAIGSGQFTLAVLGSGFTAQSQVQFNGQNRATTYVSSTEVTGVILASDLAATGSIPVTVTNPAPGGGVSNPPDVFTVLGGQNPVPAITTLAPASVSVNTGAFTLTVNGSGFIAGSQVQWNGANRVTTFISTTQLTAAILASDVIATGSPVVTVVNAAPGGGTSNSAALPVTPACSFDLTPSATTLPATQFAGTVAISTSLGCVWSAASLNSFLTITSPAAGSGSGSVSFSITANASSARMGTLVIAGQDLWLSQAGTVQGVISTAAAAAIAGGIAIIPVTLVANSGVSADKLAFSLQVTANGSSPALSGTLSFTADAALGAPSTIDTSGGAGLIGVTWLSLAAAAGGTMHLGDLTVNMPAGAVVNQTYTVQITGASGSFHSSSVSLAAGSTSTLTVGLDYLVGDNYPFTNDAAGNFGDNAINTLDLLSALRAITGVKGNVPAACSDRFDALDAFPADTATTRGGDGILNTLDLLAILQRVTGIDPSRPRRVSRELPCPQFTSQALRPERPTAGSIEIDADGSVYVRASQNLSLYTAS